MRAQWVLDSGSVRRAGKEDDRKELKPFVAIQRVRLPPGKGQPASRKQALHVCGNVTREAYGSGCRSCGLAPKSSIAEAFVVRNSGGSIEVADIGEDTSVRPGSWNGAEARDGSPEDLRDPIRVHVRKPEQGSRSTKPRPGRKPPIFQERQGETRTRRARGRRKRTNKRPLIRGWEVVAPS